MCAIMSAGKGLCREVRMEKESKKVEAHLIVGEMGWKKEKKKKIDRLADGGRTGCQTGPKIEWNLESN